MEPTPGYASVGVDRRRVEIQPLTSPHSAPLHASIANCGASCCTFWNTFTLSGLVMSGLAISAPQLRFNIIHVSRRKSYTHSLSDVNHDIVALSVGVMHSG